MVAASGAEIDWDHISSVLENGRNGSQCASRWQKVLHPQTIKGAWTPEVRELVRCSPFQVQGDLFQEQGDLVCWAFRRAVAVRFGSCAICALSGRCLRRFFAAEFFDIRMCLLA